MKATMTVAAAPGGPRAISQETRRRGTTLEHPSVTPVSVELSIIHSSFSSLYLHQSNATPFAARKSPQDSFNTWVFDQSGADFEKRLQAFGAWIPFSASSETPNITKRANFGG
jgi:hypothetical protein